MGSLTERAEFHWGFWSWLKYKIEKIFFDDSCFDDSLYAAF